MKIVKNSSFLKVSGKMACRFEFSVIFCVFQHQSKFIFDIFRKLYARRGQNFGIFESQKALNHVLTFQNAGARRELSIDVLYVTRASICVELRPFYCSKRILVPMSYITFFDNLAVLVPYMSYIVYFHKLSNYMGKRQLRIQECQFLKSA